MNKYYWIACGIAASSLLAAGTQAQNPVTQKPVKQKAPYLNRSLPLDARVQDLISRMTLAEKVDQMVNNTDAIPRLQIPAYDWWSEALHGVARSGVATSTIQ